MFFLYIITKTSDNMVSTKIPVIKQEGLMLVLGAITGVIVDVQLPKIAPQFNTPLYEGSSISKLGVIKTVLPLILMIGIKKARMFFLGWFIWAIGSLIVSTGIPAQM